MHRRTRTRALLLAVLVARVSLPSGGSVHLSVGPDVAVPPAELRLWFSGTPLLGMSGLTLDGPTGAVALAKVTEREERSLAAYMVRALSDRPYVVTGRTAGDDGHVVKGTVRFTVDQAPGIVRVAR